MVSYGRFDKCFCTFDIAVCCLLIRRIMQNDLCYCGYVVMFIMFVDMCCRGHAC